VKVTVYGPGCANCTKLEAAAREAVKQLGIEAEVTKVTDVAEIAKAGVLLTPALAIDGQMVLRGKVADVSEVMSLITSAMDGS